MPCSETWWPPTRWNYRCQKTNTWPHLLPATGRWTLHLCACHLVIWNFIHIDISTHSFRGQIKAYFYNLAFRPPKRPTSAQPSASDSTGLSSILCSLQIYLLTYLVSTRWTSVHEVDKCPPGQVDKCHKRMYHQRHACGRQVLLQ